MADLTPRAFDGMELAIVATPLKGNTGEQGAPGSTGAPGKSNYQLWLEAGNTGTIDDFLLTTKGEKGDAGASLNNRGEWSVGIYNPNDYVFAEGSVNARSMWIATSVESFISNIRPKLDPDNWIEFSTEKGDPGVDGVDGSKWFIRATAPVPETGQITDCWLNVTTGEVYQKTEDGWGDPIGVLAGGGSGGGGVASVNQKMPDAQGNVNITLTDLGGASAAQGAKADTAVQPEDLTEAIDEALNGLSLAAVATSGNYEDLSGKPTLGSAAAANASAFATASQGAKADSALQPNSVAAVATSGSYNDLSGKPSLGTAAAQNVSAFATAAQGAKADSAVQPGQLAAVAVGGKFSDLSGRPTHTSGLYSNRPSTAVESSTYYCTDIRETYRWTGAAWEIVSQGGQLLAALTYETPTPLIAGDLGNPIPLPNLTLTFTAGSRPFIIGFGTSFRSGTGGATALIVLEVNGVKTSQIFSNLPTTDFGTYYRRSRPITFPVGTTVVIRMLGSCGGTVDGVVYGGPTDPFTLEVVSV